MADLTEVLQSFRPPPLPYLDNNIDPNMEFLMTHFSELTPSVHGSSITSLNFQNTFFSSNHTVPEFPGSFDSFPGVFQEHRSGGFVSQDVYGVDVKEQRKRKEVEISESSSAISSSVYEIKNKYSSGKGSKRRKRIEKEEEKPREVVHVRARRGQATDSHSLAERVRRGKINERLKCLKDIVPGCYKTMGMAVMLDEIINYVQSLQNQVEFLSMKLTAASSFYDFNSEPDTIDKMQVCTRVQGKTRKFIDQGLNFKAMAGEPKEIERRMMRRGQYGGTANSSNPTWHP